MRCPACDATVPGFARFCPSCGRELASPDAPPTPLAAAETRLAGDETRLAGDETRLAGDETRLAGAGAASVGPSAAKAARLPTPSGWLTSSGSIDHGRFAPGTVLGQRYRIAALLGRGGMGEVYRADDLRLGQPVALKFLPAALGRDPVRLAQFHNEVRTARQVSHPNVCRVYDIGEEGDELF